MTKGPTKGGRWLVELPFGNKTNPTNTGGTRKPGKSKLVKIKQGVAKYLGFTPVKTLPTQNVTFKTAKGTATVKRVPKVGSGGGRSVTLILESDKQIGGKSVSQINVPLGTGCTNTDAIVYFQKNGSAKGIIGLVTTQGRRVIWGEEKGRK